MKNDRIRAATLRSLRLHEVAARRLLVRPDLVEVARQRLKKLRDVNPAGKPYHDCWAALLAGELPRLPQALTEDSEEAANLMRESPFTILVPKTERDRVFKSFERQ